MLLGWFLVVSLHGIAPVIQCKSPKSPLNQDTHIESYAAGSQGSPTGTFGP